MVEFQIQSGISTVLDSVDYFYVRLPCLPWYSSPHCSYHTRSFTHIGVACFRPRIPTYRSASTISWLPLHDSPPLPSSNHCFPCLHQGWPNLLLWHLLTPPWVPTATSSIIALLTCAHFEYHPQRYLLCYSFLLSLFVGHRRLPSRRLPHCFRPVYLLCPICQTSRPLTRDLSNKKSLWKNIYLVSSHSKTSPFVCAPPQMTLFSPPTTCVVDGFNAWDLTIVSHPKSLQEILNYSHPTISQESLKTNQHLHLHCVPSTRSMAQLDTSYKTIYQQRFSTCHQWQPNHRRIVAARGEKNFETDGQR